MAKRKKYVTYEQVKAGLRRSWDLPESPFTHHYSWEDDGCPKCYIRYARSITGLSYAKIAHDLRADSGTDVADSTVALWGRT